MSREAIDSVPVYEVGAYGWREASAKFDFGRVARTMELLGWEHVGGVPSCEALVRIAEVVKSRILSLPAKSGMSGGIRVTFDSSVLLGKDGYFRIAFMPSEHGHLATTEAWNQASNH
jgi:hypothetical protein